MSIILFFLTIFGCFYFALRQSIIFIFVLYQAIYFFSPQTKWWGASIPDISYSFYSIVILLIYVVFNFKLFKENNPLKIAPFRWLYLLILLYVIAYSYAVLPSLHYIAMDSFVTLGVVITICYVLCDTEKKLHYILNGYIYGAAYLSFYVYQVGRNSGNRVEGIGMPDAPDSNGVSAALAPSLALCLYYFWSQPTLLKKGVYVVAGIFIANALVLINSRGAFLGAAVSLVFLLGNYYFAKASESQGTAKQKFGVIFILITGLSGAVIIVDDSFIQRIASITSEAKGPDYQKESGSTRTEFWKGSWKMAKDHPFGAGRAGFMYYSPLYIAEGVNTGASKNRATHSTWFEALSEVGYLGLLSLIMVVFGALKLAQKTKTILKKDNKMEQYYCVVACQASLISYIVSMTFLNRLRGEILYWCITFLLISYNVYVLKTESVKKAKVK
jgi:hypothetical protein